MEISKEEFERYLKVQESGVTNMWAVKLVCRLARLSEDQVFFIMDNYGELKKKFEL